MPRRGEHRAGSLGELGCFSFYPTKNLGAFGDGGLVTAASAELDEELRVLRNHGHRDRYYSARVGGNFRLDALQAAVLRIKLRFLDAWTEGRQINANRYRELFLETGKVVELSGGGEVLDRRGIALPTERPDCRHIYNQFVVLGPRRDPPRSARGPEAARHRPRDLLSGAAAPPGVLRRPRLSQRASSRSRSWRPRQSFAVPIYPELTDTQLRSVVAAIDDALERAERAG